MLPAGTLREPPSALKRADLILLTHADIPDVSTHIKKLVKSLAPNTLVLESIHQPIYCYPLVMEAPAVQETFSRQFSAKRFSFNARKHPSKNPLFQPRTDNREPTTIPPRTDTYDIKALKGKRVLAVCGIGNPNAFVATLRRCAVARVELLEFPDHHVYTETDKQHIYTAFQETGADLIVTTQKDEQKLADVVGETGVSSPYGELPIVVLAVALVITEGDAAFTDVLLGAS